MDMSLLEHIPTHATLMASYLISALALTYILSEIEEKRNPDDFLGHDLVLVGELITASLFAIITCAQLTILVYVGVEPFYELTSLNILTAIIFGFVVGCLHTLLVTALFVYLDFFIEKFVIRLSETSRLSLLRLSILFSGVFGGMIFFYLATLFIE